jgi:hypothetical protein
LRPLIPSKTRTYLIVTGNNSKQRMNSYIQKIEDFYHWSKGILLYLYTVYHENTEFRLMKNSEHRENGIKNARCSSSGL